MVVQRVQGGFLNHSSGPSFNHKELKALRAFRSFPDPPPSNVSFSDEQSRFFQGLIQTNVQPTGNQTVFSILNQSEKVTTLLSVCDNDSIMAFSRIDEFATLHQNLPPLLRKELMHQLTGLKESVLKSRDQSKLDTGVSSYHTFKREIESFPEFDVIKSLFMWIDPKQSSLVTPAGLSVKPHSTISSLQKDQFEAFKTYCQQRSDACKDLQKGYYSQLLKDLNSLKQVDSSSEIQQSSVGQQPTLILTNGKADDRSIGGEVRLIDSPPGSSSSSNHNLQNDDSIKQFLGNRFEFNTINLNPIGALSSQTNLWYQFYSDEKSGQESNSRDESVSLIVSPKGSSSYRSHNHELVEFYPFAKELLKRAKVDYKYDDNNKEFIIDTLNVDQIDTIFLQINRNSHIDDEIKTSMKDKFIKILFPQFNKQFSLYIIKCYLKLFGADKWIHLSEPEGECHWSRDIESASQDTLNGMQKHLEVVLQQCKLESLRRITNGEGEPYLDLIRMASDLSLILSSHVDNHSANSFINNFFNSFPSNGSESPSSASSGEYDSDDEFGPEAVNDSDDEFGLEAVHESGDQTRDIFTDFFDLLEVDDTSNLSLDPKQFWSSVGDHSDFLNVNNLGWFLRELFGHIFKKAPVETVTLHPIAEYFLTNHREILDQSQIFTFEESLLPDLDNSLLVDGIHFLDTLSQLTKLEPFVNQKKEQIKGSFQKKINTINNTLMNTVHTHSSIIPSTSELLLRSDSDQDVSFEIGCAIIQMLLKPRGQFLARDHFTSVADILFSVLPKLPQECAYGLLMLLDDNQLETIQILELKERSYFDFGAFNQKRSDFLTWIQNPTLTVKQNEKPLYRALLNSYLNKNPRSPKDQPLMAFLSEYTD